MDQKHRAAAVRVLRGLHRLAGRIRVDIDAAGRPSLSITPADLNRFLPRLLLDAAKLEVLTRKGKA